MLILHEAGLQIPAQHRRGRRRVFFLASHRGHGGTERSPGGDERAQRGKEREEEDTEDELTLGREHRGSPAAEGNTEEGAESSEVSEGVGGSDGFMPHSEGTEAQRFLDHRGELTLGREHRGSPAAERETERGKQLAMRWRVEGGGGKRVVGDTAGGKGNPLF